MSVETFAGWDGELVEFFDGLTRHNTKDWFDRHRDRFDRAVRRPTEALAAQLAPRYGTPHIFRLRRDARFGAEHAPYRTALGVQFDGSGVHHYVSVGATELVASIGWFRPDRTWVGRFRKAVAGPAGPGLAEVVDSLSARGFEIGGAALKTTPRGFAPDHPRAGLLRHRGITATRRWSPPCWLDDPAALDRIAQSWDEAAGLGRWLRRMSRWETDDRQ